MSRERKTWNGGDKVAGEQPVLPVERAASAHPATPDEGPAHPAHQPDPDANKYENGDTSSWAEDPTTGPYPNSAHPATPDEGPGHPAYKAATAKEAADQLRIATERKAAKCIRISTQLLRGLTADGAIIEDQSLDLMDIPDAALNATLARLAKLAAEDGKEEEEAAAETIQEEVEEKAEKKDEEKKEDKKASNLTADDQLLRKLLAEEGMDDEDDEGDKAATSEKDATTAIMAELQNLRAEIKQLKSCGPAPMEEPVMAEGDDIEAMLTSMVEEEMGEIVEEPVMAQPEIMDEPEPAAMDEMVEIDMAPVDDPMDLMDDSVMDAEEEALLGTLFADNRLASDDEDADDEDGDEDSEDEGGSEDEDAEDEPAGEGDKESKKKASQKPRAKKASQGAQRLGGVQRTASNDDDVKDLEALWPSAPDVSKVFG